MTTIVPTPMPRQVLLIKAQGDYKHSGKYVLIQGRWHKLHQDKPAPKGAPVAAHPHAAGQYVPAKHLTDDEWEKLKLPAENVNAGTFNKQIDKLKDLAEGGHVSGILGLQYGTNTYGKKLAIIANHILGLYGSEHKVTAGQKAGEHAAVQQAPAAGEPTAEAPAKTEDKPKLGPVGQALKESVSKPAPTAKDSLEVEPASAYGKGEKFKFSTGLAKVNSGTWEIYNTSGDLVHLKKVGAKVPNSSNTVNIPKETLDQALAAGTAAKVGADGKLESKLKTTDDYLPSKPAAGSLAMPAFVEGKTTTGVVDYYQKQAKNILDMAAAGDSAGLVAMKEAGLKPNSKGKVSNTWAGKTQNSKMLLALHDQAVEHAGKQHVADKPAPAPAAQASEASTRAEPSPAEKVKQATQAATAAVEQTPEHKEAVAIAAEKLGDGSKLSQIPWDSQLLPDSNKNAKSHNKQVAKIKAMSEAGDLAGLEALKFGVNTYGKKQEKLKQLAIAALKEDAAAPASPPAPDEPVKTTREAPTHIKGQMPDWLAADPGLSDIQKQNLSNAPKMQLIEWAAGMHGASSATQSAAKKLLGKEPVADTGPQEGDTKQGADGMLVFKDGRWHKQEQPKAAEPAPAAGLEPAPTGKKLKPSEAIALGKGLKTASGMKAKLKKLAVAGDVAGLQEFVAVANGMPASKKYAQNLIAAMTDGAPATAAQPKAAPVMAANGIESMDGWKQTGPQGGSNPGGKFKDQNGVEWYCKFPSDPDVAKSEILAAKLYAAAGVTGQDAKLITKDGKIGIASKWTTVSKAKPSELSQTDGVLSGFATDAWLGNWDVVGLGFDNLQVGADGKAVRVDAGGSLTYRAQGGKKAFGNVVSEIDSLRDAKINPQASAVFGKMSEADITASVAKVLAVSDNTIRTMVELYGPGDAANKKALADTLIARKADLAAKYPKAVKVKPPKPAFKVENLTAPPSFTNWNGSGKGLSSHQNINEANQAAVDAVYDAAKQGDLAAIKEVQAPIFDKGSGEVKNHVPLAKHPSQHVKAYWSDMVNEVDLQLNPPRMPEIGEIVASQDLGEISALLKPVPAGASINMVSKHQKAGNYILLGKALDIAPAVPDDNDTVISSEAWKNKAIAHYHAATSEQKSSFSLYVTTSGARSLNTALRKGDLKAVVSGKSVATHVENFKGLLVDIPEGSTFVRRMGMKGYGQAPNEKAIKELQQFLMVAEPGTVMQEPGFTSTSWTGGNKILGNNDIEWEFVAGKGVKMFPAWLTANKGEGEGLLPPNQRYMIVSSKKDGKTVRVKAILLPTID